MDAVDYLIKVLMPEKDYFKLQKDAKIYNELQAKRLENKQKIQDKQRKYNRRRMNSR